MELWDLYNGNKELTGETMYRGDHVPERRYHLVVHVWIHDGNGRYLTLKEAKAETKILCFGNA